MISVFAGFIFSESSTIKPIGFGLAFGVLVDAFVVRMLLIPAVMHLLGKSAWWIPKWLDRILPDVDVEGAKLERSHPGDDRGHRAEPAVAGAVCRCRQVQEPERTAGRTPRTSSPTPTRTTGTRRRTAA